MSESKTIHQMSRWELVKLLANFTVVTPAGEPFNEWDLKVLRMNAFVQFIQLDWTTLFHLAQEVLKHYKETEDTKFLVES